MVTETIVLDHEDGTWRSITNTTNGLTIADISHPIKVRFGISSTSDGIPLAPGDVLVAEETVYVQQLNVKSSVVTRNGKTGGNITTIWINRM